MSSFLVLPIFLAVVGWAVTWIGVSSLFAPYRFTGIRPIFGWQGLIPARAAAIAPRLVDAVLARVGTIRDVYEAADPDRIAEHLVYSLRPRMAELVEDVFLDADPDLWDRMSDETKAEVVNRLDGALPRVVDELLDEIDAKLEQLIDIDYLTDHFLIENPAMLVTLVRSVGHREITFLKRVGAVVGIAAGIATAAAHLLEHHWWVTAILGLVIFGLGNAVAIQLVFGWPELRRVGPYWIQGMFYQHQDIGIATATRIVTRDIITVQNLVEVSLSGPSGSLTREVIRRHAAPLVDHALEPAMPEIRQTHDERQAGEFAAALTEVAIEIALVPLADPTFNRERQIVLEDVFVHRMMDLTARQWGELVIPALGGTEKLLPPAAAIAGFVAGGLGGVVAELF